MSYLSPKQIEKIEEKVSRADVKNTSLSIDLIDHICCMIEDRINQGVNFQIAENEVFRKMGIIQLKAIDIETKNLTYNTFTMKKRTKIVGIAAIALMFTGFIFKSLHLSGAAMIWSLGVLMAAFGFILLLFIDKFSYEKTISARFNSMIGHLGASGIVMGFGFKLMSWPFANDMVFIGAFVLLIYFIFNSVTIGKNVNG